MLDILVIDDDLRMNQLIVEILSEEGYSAAATSDSREAIILLRERHYDIVITDLKMPYVDGMQILTTAKQSNPDALVVMITAHGTIESAIEAIKKGAYDYIQKPFDPDQLLLIIKRAAEHLFLIYENKRLQREVKSFLQDDIIGVSRAIRDIKGIIEKVAPLDATVLIQGETGTGKELVARQIHKNSARAQKIFLPVNCGALTETLLESELFGHERGAFTGAMAQRKGLFETASGGTIFLDEINNTTASLQVKLLRVLQENMIMRVGSSKPVQVDVRIIAASNANLMEAVNSGTFRRDLFYRLNVVNIDIPPLRQRKDDIPILAYHFLNKYCRKLNKSIKNISLDAIEILNGYSWQGNVRELENVIERAVIMETSSEITPQSLPPEIKGSPADPLSCLHLMTIDEMERFLIMRTLREFKGQKNKAAESLGIDVTTLWRKIKKYNLE
ncbi:sigma-54-dependent Fis family transcriptional regulator [Dissulfurispira thermophila]|uniref:Sigma-54-dependent Fis family transcriptional regulator n=1 Tax=Dissulfurispira thermophila TaxID=2715679 RepID=A0A7G1H4H0_9BACT|nr:sigma-54 dependent transcriptional regulator [Dissulfurispira thermophila]BCB97041.1 sigma-54-dependent Fis family transcriptional regulator [Dissulfurispira thermophila]